MGINFQPLGRRANRTTEQLDSAVAREIGRAGQTLTGEIAYTRVCNYKDGDGNPVPAGSPNSAPTESLLESLVGNRESGTHGFGVDRYTPHQAAVDAPQDDKKK
jgi:hypothetical protein